MINYAPPVLHLINLSLLQRGQEAEPSLSGGKNIFFQGLTRRNGDGSVTACDTGAAAR